MRSVLIPVLLVTLALVSAASGAVVPVAAIAKTDVYTVGDIKVDATAQSPRAARDLAMAQGRPLAWNELFRRFTVEGVLGSQPQLSDNQLLGLIRSTEIGHERRSTTRYLADVIFHFDPVAVRQLLRTSKIDFAEAGSEPALVIPLQPESVVDKGSPTYLTVDVQFDTMMDWTKLRTRLSAMKSVIQVEIGGLALHEAQLDITYLGQMEQFQDMLTQQNLEWSDSESQYTLVLPTTPVAIHASLVP